MPANLHDCADVWRALREHRPGWSWQVCDEEPMNGRFYVDHEAGELWLPGYLGGDAAIRAFLAGGRELLAGADAALQASNVTLLPTWNRAAMGRRRGQVG